MMKKIIAIIGMVTMFSTVGYAGSIEQTYTMNGVIVNNNTIVDERGEAWGYDTELKNGSHVIITFSDNMTSSYIYDDVITAVAIA